MDERKPITNVSYEKGRKIKLERHSDSIKRIFIVNELIKIFSFV